MTPGEGPLSRETAGGSAFIRQVSWNRGLSPGPGHVKSVFLPTVRDLEHKGRPPAERDGTALCYGDTVPQIT